MGYFDKLGAGEVTTRIQTDTHLLQEGISDKIAITVMFMSTFFTGFIVGKYKCFSAVLLHSVRRLTLTLVPDRSLHPQLAPRPGRLHHHPVHRPRRCFHEQVHFSLQD